MRKLFVLFLMLTALATFGFSEHEWVREGGSFFLMSVSGDSYELSFLIPKKWEPVGEYCNTENWLFISCGDGKLRTVRLRRGGSAYMHEYRFEMDLPSEYGNVTAMVSQGLTADQIGLRFSGGNTCFYQVTPENGIEFLYKK